MEDVVVKDVEMILFSPGKEDILLSLTHVVSQGVYVSITD